MLIIILCMQYDIQCNICNRLYTQPIELKCSHKFCYKCIKSECYTHGYNCPKCGEEIKTEINNIKINEIKDHVDNVFYSSKFFWLYSGNSLNNWWCYDKKYNLKLEAMYKDFIKCKTIDNFKYDAGVDITLKKTPPFNAKKKAKFDMSLVRMTELYNTGKEPKTKTSFKKVDYSSYDRKQSPSSMPLPVPYELNIGRSKYGINFVKMIQYHKKYTDRRRTIRRVEIPEEINDIHMYLKTSCRTMGVSGIVYS